jgi:hypothetical protein
VAADMIKPAAAQLELSMGLMQGFITQPSKSTP